MGTGCSLPPPHPSIASSWTCAAPSLGHSGSDSRSRSLWGTGCTPAEVCRRHGLSTATFYKLKSKYGGMEVSEAARLKALEDENAKLKRLLADTMLDNVVLKDLLGKS